MFTHNARVTLRHYPVALFLLAFFSGSIEQALAHCPVQEGNNIQMLIHCSARQIKDVAFRLFAFAL